MNIRVRGGAVKPVLDQLVDHLAKAVKCHLAEGVRAETEPNKRVIDLARLSELAKRMNQMGAALERFMDSRGVPTDDDIAATSAISHSFRQFHDDNRILFPITFNEKLDGLWQLAKQVYHGHRDFIRHSPGVNRESIQRTHDAWDQLRIAHENLKAAMNMLADDGGIWIGRRNILERLESEMQINETNLDIMISPGSKTGEFQQMPILTGALEAALADRNLARSLGIRDCTSLLNALVAARQKAEKAILSQLSALSAKGDVQRMRQMVAHALAKTP